MSVVTGNRHACDRAMGAVAGAGRHHSWVSVVHHATATLRQEARAWGVVHRAVDVPAGKPSSGCLLHPDLVALGNLALELLPAHFAALSKGRQRRRRQAKRTFCTTFLYLTSFTDLSAPPSSAALTFVFTFERSCATRM